MWMFRNQLQCVEVSDPTPRSSRVADSPEEATAEPAGRLHIGELDAVRLALRHADPSGPL